MMIGFFQSFLLIGYLLQELHSTRGVLSGERARAFQLQVPILN
jgi:hypothetical protein